MNELLEKAKQMYPIGTKFKSLYKSNDYVVTKEIFSHYGNIYTTDDNLAVRCIYDTEYKKWAEIIKEETMFKKGDYIVTLINHGDCGKVNYCSKQRIDHIYLHPEKDRNGRKDNNNNTFEFSDKSGWKWRFATKEEGEEYEKHGKPYNVTNIVKNNMTIQEYENLKVGDILNDYTIIHKYKQLLIVESKNGHDLLDLDKINKLELKVTPKTFMGLEIKKYDNVPCEVNGDHLAYLLEVKEKSILVTHQKNGIYPYSDIPTSIRLL
jgi:hypothetical protein